VHEPDSSKAGEVLLADRNFKLYLILAFVTFTVIAEII
jgi:hypothetical protein